jgi:hypothetical protein
MIRDIQLEVIDCTCNICHHRWRIKTRIVLLPSRCPWCRSREWDGPLALPAEDRQLSAR